MQFINFLRLFIFCSVLMSVQSLNAQKIAYNQHGERIVVFPNEKWEYYDASNPLHRVAMKAYEEGLSEKGDSAEAEETPQQKYQNLVLLAEEELALAEERESDIKFSIILLEEDMEDVQADKTSQPDRLAEIKKQLKLATQLEKEAKKNTKKARKKLKKLKKNSKKIMASHRKKKPSKKSKKSKKQQKIKNTLQNSAATFQEDASFYTASKRFKKYDVEEDVMYNPPRIDCEIAFDGVDNFSGKKRKDVARTVLFTHTDEAMQRYMEGQDYIICEGNLTRIKGGVLFL
ncbi:MAG TPA: hypothetical protein ENJ53_04085, partial [Phaeodactylibacter sp.]|nr:hypothetical protein [Phaeodactylibacter sp.]